MTKRKVNQEKLRFFLGIILWLVRSRQWITLLKLLVWMIQAKSGWQEAIDRESGVYYDVQVKEAVERYKEKTGWSDRPTTNMSGYAKYLDSVKK